MTERHRIQEELARTERRLRQSLIEIESIYDNADVGLAVVDRDLRHRRINRRLAEINGVSVEQTLGRTVREVLPKLADDLEPLYQKVIDRGESILNLEVEGETPSRPGERRAFVVSYLPLRTADDVDIEEDGNIESIRDIEGMQSPDASEVTGVNVVVHEITARKQIEERLEQARREAESSRDAAEKVLHDVGRDQAVGNRCGDGEGPFSGGVVARTADAAHADPRRVECSGGRRSGSELRGAVRPDPSQHRARGPTDRRPARHDADRARQAEA